MDRTQDRRWTILSIRIPTTGSTCSDGVCANGSPKDCSDTGNVCRVGICNQSDGSCGSYPGMNGTPCDTGDLCTVDDACLNGTCTVGVPKDCSYLDTECTVGVCDPDDGGCKAVPINEGVACNEGNLCRLGATCDAGVCAGGQMHDCSGLDTFCAEGVCNPTTGHCGVVPLNEGASCEDGSLCTVDTVCAGGTCVGPGTDCSHLDSPCMVGVCDPTDGSCGAVPVANGTSCDTGNLCTVGDVCMEGVCEEGGPKSCAAHDSQCTVGVCDPTDGSCFAEPANEGASCDDGLTCTDSTVCIAGVCAGGNSPACSMTPDGCCPNSCDETNDWDCMCPGEEIGGHCVYAPSTGSVPDKASAEAVCSGLGPGWGLCPVSVTCLTATKDYLADIGCSCSGGDATCSCSTNSNIYVHVDDPSTTFSYWLRYPTTGVYPGCVVDNSCTASASITCGTPLCCR